MKFYKFKKVLSNFRVYCRSHGETEKTTYSQSLLFPSLLEAINADNTYILCENKKEVLQLLEFAHNNGKRWCTGRSYIDESMRSAMFSEMRDWGIYHYIKGGTFYDDTDNPQGRVILKYSDLVSSPIRSIYDIT